MQRIRDEKNSNKKQRKESYIYHFDRVQDQDKHDMTKGKVQENEILVWRNGTDMQGAYVHLMPRCPELPELYQAYLSLH